MAPAVVILAWDAVVMAESPLVRVAGLKLVADIEAVSVRTDPEVCDSNGFPVVVATDASDVMAAEDVSVRLPELVAGNSTVVRLELAVVVSGSSPGSLDEGRSVVCVNSEAVIEGTDPELAKDSDEKEACEEAENCVLAMAEAVNDMDVDVLSADDVTKEVSDPVWVAI